MVLQTDGTKKWNFSFTMKLLHWKERRSWLIRTPDMCPMKIWNDEAATTAYWSISARASCWSNQELGIIHDFLISNAYIVIIALAPLCQGPLRPSMCHVCIQLWSICYQVRNYKLSLKCSFLINTQRCTFWPAAAVVQFQASYVSFLIILGPESLIFCPLKQSNKQVCKILVGHFARKLLPEGKTILLLEDWWIPQVLWVAASTIHNYIIVHLWFVFGRFPFQYNTQNF